MAHSANPRKMRKWCKEIGLIFVRNTGCGHALYQHPNTGEFITVSTHGGELPFQEAQQLSKFLDINIRTIGQKHARTNITA